MINFNLREVTTLLQRHIEIIERCNPARRGLVSRFPWPHDWRDWRRVELWVYYVFEAIVYVERELGDSSAMTQRHLQRRAFTPPWRDAFFAATALVPTSPGWVTLFDLVRTLRAEIEAAPVTPSRFPPIPPRPEPRRD